MVVPAVGSVVLVPFPFSDLSHSKKRPAVVIGDAGRGDWILCQLTSRSWSDVSSVELDSSDFISGGLRLTSYARPGKLFTANQEIFLSEEGRLGPDAVHRITSKVCALLGNP
jgi:mRNA interferase MazF